jgi:hypothetical protein
MENRETIGEDGDIYLQPLNMVPAGTDPAALTAAADARASVPRRVRRRRRPDEARRVVDARARARSPIDRAMDLRKAKQIAAKLDGVRSFSIADVEIREAPAGSKSPGGVRFYAACTTRARSTSAASAKRSRRRVRRGDRRGRHSRARQSRREPRSSDAARPRRASRPRSSLRDERGLLVDIPELPDTSYARDLLVSLERGDVDQCSFGFRLAVRRRVAQGRRRRSSGR